MSYLGIRNATKILIAALFGVLSVALLALVSVSSHSSVPVTPTTLPAQWFVPVLPTVPLGDPAPITGHLETRVKPDCRPAALPDLPPICVIIEYDIYVPD